MHVMRYRKPDIQLPPEVVCVSFRVTGLVCIFFTGSEKNWCQNLSLLRINEWNDIMLHHQSRICHALTLAVYDGGVNCELQSWLRWYSISYFQKIFYCLLLAGSEYCFAKNLIARRCATSDADQCNERSLMVVVDCDHIFWRVPRRKTQHFLILRY